ncbi:hypothetical protein AB5J72_04395 [Streptomyces sp. CG1]|uniref:hypothetical protein n=1 Tax=Streptomyces sp. CG1 TaxID=1287523 RepID=UPI0034E30070
MTADSAYDTAGIVKVDTLAALLLQAQDSGRQLTTEERQHGRQRALAPDRPGLRAGDGQQAVGRPRPRAGPASHED